LDVATGGFFNFALLLLGRGVDEPEGCGGGGGAFALGPALEGFVEVVTVVEAVVAVPGACLTLARLGVILACFGSGCGVLLGDGRGDAAIATAGVCGAPLP